MWITDEEYCFDWTESLWWLRFSLNKQITWLIIHHRSSANVIGADGEIESVCGSLMNNSTLTALNLSRLWRKKRNNIQFNGFTCQRIGNHIGQEGIGFVDGLLKANTNLNELNLGCRWTCFNISINIWLYTNERDWHASWRDSKDKQIING